jgi:Kef-type K+ transport system membrane component KefB
MVIGHSAIALPFLGGVAAAFWLYPHYRPAQGGALPFTLFIGLCFSITAFPVLARILDEQRLLTSRIGTIGIGAAGICDLTAWCLLAVVVTIAHHATLLPALTSIGLALLFTAAMFAFVRPVLARILAYADRAATPPIALYAGIICVLLLCALATDAIGVHPIFGAFLAGIVMPRHSRLVGDLQEKLAGVTLWVLLPLFFVSVGLRTDLGADSSVTTLAGCGLIIVVAMATKVAGGALGAAAVGESKRDALAVGVMMNCRGLTELVVLNLGRQLGLLSPTLFAMFVIMAVVTTGVTGPLLRLIVRDRAGTGASAPASATELAGRDR